MRAPDPVGIEEVAARLRRTPGEIHRLYATGYMPAPRWPAVNGGPCWRWADVATWAATYAHLPNLPTLGRPRLERTTA